MEVRGLRKYVLGCMAVLVASSAAGKDRQWEIRFEGFFQNGTMPLTVYARERDGKWVTVMGSSRAPGSGKARYGYNKNYLCGDFSGIPIADGKVKGRALVYITPDPWMPLDHKPFAVEMEIDAAVAEDGVSGSYKVTSVNSKDGTAAPIRGASGEITGAGAEREPPALPEKITYEINLQGALVGGDPSFGQRCLVLRLGFDGDKLVSTVHGKLSRKNLVHSEAPARQAPDAVARTGDRFKGRLVIPTETLDMESVTYTVDIDGGPMASFAIGTYKLTAEGKDSEPITQVGGFDGKWTKGAGVAEIDDRPWYSAVPGFVPLKPGEHPRLLFRKSDIEALRKKAETPEGRAILARVRQTLDGGNGDTAPAVGNLTIGHMAGYGLLYQVTGDAGYADLAKVCFERMLAGEKDPDQRYSFKNPSGPLRAGPSLGWTAVGYDLCYDAWDAATREKFGRAIAEYNENQKSELESLTRGTMPPGSNHYGMQVGGSALALLAVTGEPFVDQKRIDKLLKISGVSMMRNLTEGFGDGGFFAEGDGTGSMASQIAFISALQAWKNAMGRDYINVERPNARMMTLKWIYLTIIRGGQPDFWPKRGAYTHNIWTRRGQSGAGYFAVGMGGVTEEQKAAMKWYYDRFLREHDRKTGVPYDTVSKYPNYSVSSFVNWPVGMEGRNPAKVLPHCYRDTIHGFVAWRNRWQDDNDVIISVLLKNTRGYHKADADGSLQIRGFGEKFSWSKAAGDIDYWWQDERGAATVMTMGNVSTAVDFTKASGAAVLLATTGGGGGAKFPLGEGAVVPGTPFRGKAPQVTVKLLTEGDAPTPTVKNYVVTVGKRTIALKDGNLVLGTVE